MSVEIGNWEFDANVTGWELNDGGDAEGSLTWNAGGWLVGQWTTTGTRQQIRTIIAPGFSLGAGSIVRVRLKHSTVQPGSHLTVKLAQVQSPNTETSLTQPLSPPTLPTWTDFDEQATLPWDSVGGIILALDSQASTAEGWYIDDVIVDVLTLVPAPESNPIQAYGNDAPVAHTNPVATYSNSAPGAETNPVASYSNSSPTAESNPVASYGDGSPSPMDLAYSFSSSLPVPVPLWEGVHRPDILTDEHGSPRTDEHGEPITLRV